MLQMSPSQRGVEDGKRLNARWARRGHSPGPGAYDPHQVGSTAQTLSGTGACRVAGEFYARFLPEGTAVYVSDPTWGNHIPIMELAGLEVRKYRYLDRKTNGLDYEAFLEDIDAAPAGSVFLLHACAHNPTGVDPTPEQWRVAVWNSKWT